MDWSALFKDPANRVQGLKVIGRTLVGFNPSLPFPRARGNCFTMSADDGNEYRILNFGFENFEHAVNTGKLTYPVQIIVLPSVKKCALIHDARIPDKWYDNNLCPVCTPDQFLPITYFAQQSREVLSGAAGESTVEIDGRVTTIRVVRCVVPRVSWD